MQQFIGISLREIIDSDGSVSIETISSRLNTGYKEDLEDILGDQLFGGSFPEGLSLEIGLVEPVYTSGVSLKPGTSNVSFDVKSLLSEDSLPSFKLVAKLAYDAVEAPVSVFDKEIAESINEIGGYEVDIHIDISSDSISSLSGLRLAKGQYSQDTETFLNSAFAEGYLYLDNADGLEDTYLITLLDESLSTRVLVDDEVVSSNNSIGFSAGSSTSNPFKITSDGKLVIAGQANNLEPGSYAYIFTKSDDVEIAISTLLGAALVQDDGSYELVLNDTQQSLLSSGSHLLRIRGTNDQDQEVISNEFGYTSTQEGGVQITGLLPRLDAAEDPELTYTATLSDQGQPPLVDGLTLDPVNFSWTFDPSTSTLDFIKEGESRVLEINYSYNNLSGSRSSNSLQISITGTNDSATITGDVSSSVQGPRDPVA